LSEQSGLLKALIRELRPHQWSKNALVLVPPLLAPGLPDPAVLSRGLLAAFTFSLCASAGYVLNDLLDLEADRGHPTKKDRPFASGALPPAFGPPLGVALVTASFGLGQMIGPGLAGWMRDATGSFEAPSLIAAAVLVAGAAVTWPLGRRTTR